MTGLLSSSVNLQQYDLSVLERETEFECHGTPRKIPGELRLEDCLSVPLGDLERRDGVAVFPLCLSLPSLDGGQTFDRLAFVSHYGMFGKAFRHGVHITPILGGGI